MEGGRWLGAGLSTGAGPRMQGVDVPPAVPALLWAPPPNPCLLLGHRFSCLQVPEIGPDTSLRASGSGALPLIEPEGSTAC